MSSQTLEALLAESDSSSDSDDPSSIISQPISSVDDSGVEINNTYSMELERILAESSDEDEDENENENE
ncbi:hypothetical protein TrRE_jg12556, partial [Triparma retinervis]